MNQSTYAVLPSRTELQTANMRTGRTTTPEPEPMATESAEITIGRRHLVDLLNRACKVTPKRHHREPLTLVYLRLGSQGIELISTDGEAHLRQRSDQCKTTGCTETLINPDDLRAIVRKLKTAEVRIAITRPPQARTGEVSPIAVLTTDRATLEIDAWDPEAPDTTDQEIGRHHAIEQFTPIASARIDADAFRRLVDQTSFATDQDSTRYALAGLQTEISPDRLTMVATDSRRLVFHSADAATVFHNSGHLEADLEPAADAEQHGVIPVGRMQLVAQLAKSADSVVVDLGTTTARLTVGDTVIQTKLIDGRFPNWRDVVPHDAGIVQVLEIDRGILLESIETARIAPGEDQGGTFRIATETATEITLERCKATVRIPVRHHVLDDTQCLTDRVGLNLTCLRDWLTAIDAETVVVGMLPADSATHHNPAGQQCHAVKLQAERSSEYVLMPLTVENSK